MSSALLEERQAVQRLRWQIKDYHIKLRRDELESLRQLKVMKRNEFFRASRSTHHRCHLTSPLTLVHTDPGNLAFHVQQARRLKEGLRNRAPFPEIPRPAPREVPENSLPFQFPASSQLPAVGSGYDVLFGCPQPVLVPVSAPDFEGCSQQVLVPVPAPDFETIAIHQAAAPSAV